MHDSMLKSKLLFLLLLAFKSGSSHSSNNEKLLSGEVPIYCIASHNNCKINSAGRHTWAVELPSPAAEIIRTIPGMVLA